MLSGEHHQHQLAYHYMQLFCKHIKCEVKHNGIGDKALMAEMGGAFMTQMGGTVMAKGVYCFLGHMFKNTGLQGNFQSSHDHEFCTL